MNPPDNQHSSAPSPDIDTQTEFQLALRQRRINDLLVSAPF